MSFISPRLARMTTAIPMTYAASPKIIPTSIHGNPEELGARPELACEMYAYSIKPAAIAMVAFLTRYLSYLVPIALIKSALLDGASLAIEGPRTDTYRTDAPIHSTTVPM